MHAHTLLYIHTHAHTCTCTYTHAHTHTHALLTYTHTHTHIVSNAKKGKIDEFIHLLRQKHPKKQPYFFFIICIYIIKYYCLEIEKLSCFLIFFLTGFNVIKEHSIFFLINITDARLPT